LFLTRRALGCQDSRPDAHAINFVMPRRGALEAEFAYLPKPYPAFTLVAKIREVLISAQ